MEKKGNYKAQHRFSLPDSGSVRLCFMFLESYYLVYPDGDTQEIEGPVVFNTLVDINGRTVNPPLQSHRIIIYRVFRVKREETKGERISYFFLELLKGEELFSLVRK